MTAAKLSPSTALLLTVPPLLWAGNAVVGRLVRAAVPPMTLNLLRWTIALMILLPLGRRLFRPGGALLANWRRYALLGLLGIGLYNSLQYLALQTSTPINVTLVAASMPVWILLVGRLCFGARVRGRQLGGALLSIAGVLLVLSHGSWEALLAMRLVPGDVYMILATIAWSFYSWMLTQPEPVPSRWSSRSGRSSKSGTGQTHGSVPDVSDAPDAAPVRADWAAFLLAQVIYGVLWSGAFAGVEWSQGVQHIDWSWPVAAALLYVAIGPAVIAFRCWGAGVQRAGPSVGAFFVNLTPLFTALLSSAFLGEPPHAYHAIAFALIVGGIVYSARGN